MNTDLGLMDTTEPNTLRGQMKAHQRIVREQKSAQNGADGLFGNWWGKIDTDIKKAELRETTLRTASKIIEEYEYLGTMPNAPMKAYGIFWDGNCGGVVVFGAVSPPSVSESVISQPYCEKVIQLGRGACVHWAHPHSASKLIAFGLRQIEKEGWQIVIAYADPDAGEIGTVYQASNWIYCGLTAKRPDYFCNGIRWVGHMQKGDAAILEKGERTRKGRYIYILGSKTERRQLKKALLWQAQPYPKRAAEVSEATRDGSTVESEVQFLDAAPLFP